MAAENDAPVRDKELGTGGEWIRVVLPFVVLEKSTLPIVYQKGEGAGFVLDVVEDVVQGYGDHIGDMVV